MITDIGGSFPTFLWPKQWKTRNPNDVTTPGNTRKNRDSHAAKSKCRSCNVFMLKMVDKLLNRPNMIPLQKSSRDNRMSSLFFEQHSGDGILFALSYITEIPVIDRCEYCTDASTQKGLKNQTI